MLSYKMAFCNMMMLTCHINQIYVKTANNTVDEVEGSIITTMV